MVAFSAYHLFALAAFVCSSLECIYAGFCIDYDRNTFLMDGQPFRYVSGSAHYFRIPREYWRDRLRKIRAAGLNAVCTYVEWSQHEPEPGQYDFSGDLNITEFLRIAEEEDLYVLLRPGPYICAERDMGGLPYWLLKNHPDIYLRSTDVRYTEPVKRWLDVLFPIIQPFLYGNGGRIILVQVENEYGEYSSAASNDYKEWLRDLFKHYVKNTAVLYTTDPAETLELGRISGVYVTVDFGTDLNVTSGFAAQRMYAPNGPLVNSEFYPGWLTHWGDDLPHVDTSAVVKTLKEMLDLGANVNFYMFHGGTNFGFTAGAEFNNDTYQSEITSYDYDAPVSEAGDLTEKYYAIRETVARYLPRTNITVRTHDKGDYGEVTLQATASLFSPKIRSTLGIANQNRFPKTFESLGQNFGYLLYETEIPEKMTEQDLYIEEVHDFANVYLNGDFLGSLSREFKNNTIEIPSSNEGDRLTIVVENLGRINAGAAINDSKGILSNVTLGGKVLESWTMTSFELKNITPIYDCDLDCNNFQGFIFYTTKVVLYSNHVSQDIPLDSYLDVSNLTKGLVFVNGRNLGRYWPTRKPQKTLYVPGVYLNAPPAENMIVIVDENIRDEALTVRFKTTPNFLRADVC